MIDNLFPLEAQNPLPTLDEMYEYLDTIDPRFDSEEWNEEQTAIDAYMAGQNKWLERMSCLIENDRRLDVKLLTVKVKHLSEELSEQANKPDDNMTPQHLMSRQARVDLATASHTIVSNDKSPEEKKDALVLLLNDQKELRSRYQQRCSLIGWHGAS